MDSSPPVPDAAQSAVVIPVPEAEPVVARHRAHLDAAAAQGVPAHVTVLYPFVPPADITPATVALLAEAVASVAAFESHFRTTGWFGQEVLYLVPEPARRFGALMRAVWAAFPGYPPFGGVFDDVVPHLTVGAYPAGGVAALRAAEAAVAPGLPVTTSVRQVWLMTGTEAPASWHPLAELPLAPGS